MNFHPEYAMKIIDYVFANFIPWFMLFALAVLFVMIVTMIVVEFKHFCKKGGR